MKVVGDRFSEADKRRILDQAGQDGASVAENRRDGFDHRFLRRWKQELVTAPAFVTVQLTDAETVS